MEPFNGFDKLKYVHDLFYDDFWNNELLTRFFLRYDSVKLLIEEAEQGNYAALVPLYYAYKYKIFLSKDTRSMFGFLSLDAYDNDNIKHDDTLFLSRWRLKARYLEDDNTAREQALQKEIWFAQGLCGQCGGKKGKCIHTKKELPNFIYYILEALKFLLAVIFLPLYGLVKLFEKIKELIKKEEDWITMDDLRTVMKPDANKVISNRPLIEKNPNSPGLFKALQNLAYTGNIERNDIQHANFENEINIYKSIKELTVDYSKPDIDLVYFRLDAGLYHCKIDDIDEGFSLIEDSVKILSFISKLNEWIQSDGLSNIYLFKIADEYKRARMFSKAIEYYNKSVEGCNLSIDRDQEIHSEAMSHIEECYKKM